MLARGHPASVELEPLMLTWSGIAHFAERVPSGVWMALVIANVVVTFGMWSAAQRRLRRAGEVSFHTRDYS